MRVIARKFPDSNRRATERHGDVHPPLSHLDSPEALGDQRPERGHCREFRPRARGRAGPDPAAARPHPGRRRDLPPQSRGAAARPCGRRARPSCRPSTRWPAGPARRRTGMSTMPMRCKPEEVDEPLAFSFANGEPARMTRGEMLLHVAMHAAGHRGQVGAAAAEERHPALARPDHGLPAGRGCRHEGRGGMIKRLPPLRGRHEGEATSAAIYQRL